MGLKFSELNLPQEIIEGLDAMGFEEATPIQEMSIPETIQGKDILGIAQTGTGKTAAFVIPTMKKILESDRSKINALIIVPTRELAKQIDQAIQGLGYFAGITSMAIYGGGDGKEFIKEKKALSQGADIIIATPGRLLSHLRMGYTDFSHLQVLIFDEADRMLDMGFFDDIMKIVREVKEERQTLMFSATMPKKIEELSKKLLKDPVKFNMGISKPAAGVSQSAFVVFDKQKIPLIVSVLKKNSDLDSIIIFTSRKNTVNDIHRELKRAKINARKMSSNLDQSEREQVMLDFKNRKFPVLVATDVISRGIDINNIGMVINFDIPSDAEDYVHRVGRTARAKTTGEAITFISPSEQSKFLRIEELIEFTVPKTPLPEEIGEGPAYKPKKHRGGSGYRNKGGYKGNKKRKGNNTGGGKKKGYWQNKKKNNGKSES